jgi:hypothetical protein
MGEVFALFWWLMVIAVIMMGVDYVLFSVFEKDQAQRVQKFFMVAATLAGIFILFRFVNDHLLREIMVFYETFF